MQQTLLTRFQGALVGVYVAHHGQVVPTNQLQTFKNYALLAGASIESILHCRNLNVEDWLVAVSRLISPDQILIAILPIALYLHEDIPRLQETIRQIGDCFQLDADSMESLLFLATGVAFLCAERCSAADFIPQVLAAQMTPARSPLVHQQLQLVHEQIWVQPIPSTIPRLIGEIITQEQPCLQPIAMACYCFLGSPHNLRLSVQRAAQVPRQTSLTLALTSLFAGTLQGIQGVPFSWHANDIRTAEQLMQLAEKLLAVWAGVYQPNIRLTGKSQVVAAPGILRQNR